MVFSEFVRLLNFASPIVLFIGSVTGLYYFKSLNVIHKGIFWYLLGLLLVDLTSRVVGATGNNFIVLLVYSLLEMTLFTWFYFRFFFKAKHRLVMGLSCVAFFYILWEIMTFERTDMKGFQSYAKVIDNFIVIILVFSFFHEKINIFKDSKWENFRLNVVILLFFSVNLVFFLPLNFLVNESAGMKFYFWLGIVITTVLFYLYLTLSIWKNGRTQKLLLSGLR